MHVLVFLIAADEMPLRVQIEPVPSVEREFNG